MVTLTIEEQEQVPRKQRIAEVLGDDSRKSMKAFSHIGVMTEHENANLCTDSNHERLSESDGADAA